MQKGYLVLESGDIFEGVMIGAEKQTVGEVVFNTSMTGYQEIITDPSYAGQIMTFCFPLIGNYGINALDDESERLALSGVIISDLCQTPSHYLSIETFSTHLKKAGVPGLAGIDTRALVKKIREKGTMRGVISTQPTSYIPSLDVHLVERVSTKIIQQYGSAGPHVVLIDFGHKKSIAAALLDEGCRLTIVPHTITFDEVKKFQPDGIVFSNGPGDPMDLAPL